MEHTYVNSLAPLADMKNLKTLNINDTPIDNLEPLMGNSHLEIIWADRCNIGKEQVIKLRSVLPNVTVVYHSESLRDWWNSLDATWQILLKHQISCKGYDPTDLELQQIQNLTVFQVEQEHQIQTLEPLRDLAWLEIINIANQGIHDIYPLEGKVYLKEVYLQNNPISDLESIANDTLITVLNIENTQISDLSKVEKMKHLRTLNAGGTGIKNLKPLSKMNELEELFINNTSIKSISPIEDLPSLKLLKIYNTKVKNKTVNALQQKRFDLNIVYY